MLRAEVADRCEDGVKFFQGQVRILSPQFGKAGSDLLIVDYLTGELSEEEAWKIIHVPTIQEQKQRGLVTAT